MRKLFFLMLLMFGLAAMLVVTGCGDDETTTTGSQDDPRLETFTDLFEFVEGGIVDLSGAPFQFMDTIATEGGVASKIGWAPKVNNETFTLTWLASTSFWYCTAVFVDSGTTISMTDSIQFRHGSVPVQYPIDDSLTQIISYATLVATGEGIDTAYVFQNFTISHDPSTGSLVINGSGGSNAALTEDSCTVEWDYSQTFTNLSWYGDFMFDETSDEMYCPHTGTVAYTGAISGYCEGGTDTINGNWNVIGTFDGGTTSYEVTTEGTSWTITDTCDTGFSEELTSADTAFIEDMFGGGAIAEGLSGFELGFALMAEQGLMDPMNSPKENRFGESALADTVIVTVINSYTYLNGWHIFNFSAKAIDFQDTIMISGIDSLKALMGGSPVDIIADLYGLDSLLHHAHLSVSASGDEGLVEGSMHHVMSAAINISGLDTTVTFLGNVHDTVSVVSRDSLGGVCEIDLTLDQAVNSLVIYPETEGVCPLSGEVVSEFGMNINCSSGNDLNMFVIDDGWTSTAVANGNNTVTVTFENDAGTISWTKIIDCNELSPSIISLLTK